MCEFQHLWLVDLSFARHFTQMLIGETWLNLIVYYWNMLKRQVPHVCCQNPIFDVSFPIVEMISQFLLGWTWFQHRSFGLPINIYLEPGYLLVNSTVCGRIPVLDLFSPQSNFLLVDLPLKKAGLPLFWKSHSDFCGFTHPHPCCLNHASRSAD